MKERNIEVEVDVVVVGAGGAGLAAAIESRHAKADTLVFEKQATVDEASSSLCGGAMAFAGTDLQKREGIQDSNDLLYKDFMETGHWENDKKLVQAYVENQLDTFYWLTRLGVKWINIDSGGGHSVPRGHYVDAADSLRLLKETAEKEGAKILFETRVTGLLTDTDKRVIGVSAEGKGGSMHVKARNGVVLASGGFSRDVERLKTIDPRFGDVVKVVPVSGLGHTGDGHRMAEELGAFFKDVKNVKPSFGLHSSSSEWASYSLMYYNGAIIVNKRGKRFYNESASYKDIGKAALDQPDGTGYQIFDQKIYEVGLKKAKGVRPEKAAHGLDELKIRLLVTAKTIEELASKIAVPPKVLKETIDRYNIQADAGKDLDFGRTALAGATGRLVRIDTPPFYAYESKCPMVSTYSGIAVDEAMHVLTRHGRIPGLYAAGEIVGGLHGSSYMLGSALGKGIIFGRIAGRNAARGS